MEKNSALRRDTKNIIKNWFISIIFTGIIIWLLFFIFNVFAWLVIKENKISETISSKLWMYFYIQDETTTKTNEEIYKRIIEIKDELAKNWIKSEFSSKNDAFSYLETKIPEITENFEKFWIENTLPSTLYVMFDSEKKYNIMKDIIVANKDIILNVKDVDKWATLQQQENRSLKVLNLIKTIKYISIFMAIILWVAIIFFTQHLLRHFFYNSYKEIQVKKLLGATKTDANGWFLITLLLTITIWFILWYLIWRSTCWLLNIHLESLNISLWLTDWKVMAYLLIPYIVFTAIALTTGQLMLVKMEKKF